MLRALSPGSAQAAKFSEITGALYTNLVVVQEVRYWSDPMIAPPSSWRRHSRQRMTSTRTCGTCSLCCKLPYVSELNKPIDPWCKHASPGREGGGCLIYPDRPPPSLAPR
jgi:hypothetical protein